MVLLLLWRQCELIVITMLFTLKVMMAMKIKMVSVMLVLTMMNRW